MQELRLEIVYLITFDKKGKKSEEIYESPNRSLCIKREVDGGYLLKSIHNVAIDRDDNLVFSLDMEDGDEFILADTFSCYFDLFGLKEYSKSGLKKAAI